MPSRQINEFSQKGNRKKIELMARPETNEKGKKKKKEKWSEERKMEAKLKREKSEAQPANNPPKKRAKKHERKREKLSKKEEGRSESRSPIRYVTTLHSFFTFRELHSVYSNRDGRILTLVLSLIFFTF